MQNLKLVINVEMLKLIIKIYKCFQAELKIEMIYVENLSRTSLYKAYVSCVIKMSIY